MLCEAAADTLRDDGYDSQSHELLANAAYETPHKSTGVSGAPDTLGSLVPKMGSLAISPGAQDTLGGEVVPKQLVEETHAAVCNALRLVEMASMACENNQQVPPASLDACNSPGITPTEIEETPKRDTVVDISETPEPVAATPVPETLAKTATPVLETAAETADPIAATLVPETVAETAEPDASQSPGPLVAKLAPKTAAKATAKAARKAAKSQEKTSARAAKAKAKALKLKAKVERSAATRAKTGASPKAKAVAKAAGKRKDSKPKAVAEATGKRKDSKGSSSNKSKTPKQDPPPPPGKKPTDHQPEDPVYANGMTEKDVIKKLHSVPW